MAGGASWKCNSCALPCATRCTRIRCGDFDPGGSHDQRQKRIWLDLLSNSSSWLGNRLYKRSLGDAAFGHSLTRRSSWSNNWYRPMSVHSRITTLDPALPSVAAQGSSSVWPFKLLAEIEALCRAGQLGKALDVLFRMDHAGAVPSVNAYRSVLKECTKRKALGQAKRVQAHLSQHGLESSRFLGEYVVSTLVKCGGLEDALRVFQRLPHRTAFSWTAVIYGHTKAGKNREALRMYQCMREEGLEPDKHTFASLLKACGSLSDLKEGKRIHAEALKYMWDSDLIVGTCLVDMYVKCGSILDAVNVFDKLSSRDVVSWTTMLAGYAHHGQPETAVHLYECMRSQGVSPDDRTFVSVFQACGMLAEKEEDVALERGYIKPTSLLRGKTIHANSHRKGYDSDIFVSSTLVSMYGKCGSIVDAQKVFEGMSHRNLVAWTAMLAAYVQHGQAGKALDLYANMQKEGMSPDARTIVSAVQACGILSERGADVVVDGQSLKLQCLQQVKALHADAQRKGYDSHIFVGNTLVSFYGKCGSIVDAQVVFNRLCQLDVVSWTAMIAAYVQQGLADKALQLYNEMQQEDLSPEVRTYVSTLQACGVLAEGEDGVMVEGLCIKTTSLGKGKAIHADAWRKGCEVDVFVGSTLISFYGKCGSIMDAWNVFDGLPQQNVVTFNAMLAAYALQDEVEKALQLYAEMLEHDVTPDERTFVSLLQACGTHAEEEDIIPQRPPMKLKSLEMVKAIHADGWKRGHNSDVFVGNALVSVYGKCGSIVDAQIVFDRLSQRTVVSWNALVTAYVQQDQGSKAFQVYKQMQAEGISPNEITMVCILQAYSDTGSLDLCRQIHRNLVSSGKGLSPLLASTLIHAYGRCASMIEAHSLFDALSQPDLVSWTALMAGYARDGDSTACIRCYEKMQLAPIKPDGVTFLSLLSACSHAGLVDKAVEYFESMSRDYGITPQIEHYATMVDLLGRAGYFKSVGDLLSRMPMKPDVTIWSTLLGACQKHGRVVLGKWAFDCAVQLAPNHSATYVLMMNIYRDAGLWDNAKEVQELRGKVVTWKEPGQSWIEQEQEVHTFVVSDRRHGQQEELYGLLSEVGLMLELEGVSM